MIPARAYYDSWIPAFAGMTCRGGPSMCVSTARGRYLSECPQFEGGISVTDSSSRFDGGWNGVLLCGSPIGKVGHYTRRSCTSLSAVPDITLNDNNTIPQLGFGVFQIEPNETAEAVQLALDIGYRHIDTAEMYGNERGVGEGIRAAGIERGDVYVTSKLNNSFHEPAEARRAFDRTLSELGFDYVDLFLIHWPLPTLYDGDYVSTWRTLEEFRADGRARSIGVSNFQVEHLERLAAETDTVPAVNQIELHPYFLNGEVHEYGQEHGIATEAWSPIARGAVLDEPVIAEVAGRVSRTPAQVVLRWHLERGTIVFPKSTTPARIRENFGLSGFALEAVDCEAIDALNRGEAGRIGAHPDAFAYVPA